MKPASRHEVWRPVIGYEGKYEVSSFGRARSLMHRHGRRATPIVLRPARNGSKAEHLMVSLCRTVDGVWQRKSRLVHVLVLEAFVGPRPGSLFGLHRDGDAVNNYYENLYWGTQTDNMADARRHGTIAEGERNGHAKLTVENVMNIRRRLAFGETSVVIAKDYGVTSGTVRKIGTFSRWKNV